MGINTKAFALSAGILWSLAVFATTLLAAATGLGKAFMEAYGSLHPGYSIGLSGAFIGLIYSFFCGAIGAYAFAWLYNKLEARFY